MHICFVLFISPKQHKCVHNNFSGILYAGPLALVFFGRIFFFEWTVVIKWEDVVHVKRRNEGIRIEVRAPKPTFYDFEQVFNPEKVWSSLVSLHNDTIIDAPRKPGAPTPRQVVQSLRRRNSDPLQIAKIFDFSEPPTGLEGNSDLIKNLQKGSLVRSGSVPSPRDSLSTPSQDPMQEPNSPPGAILEKQWSEIKGNTSSYAEAAIEVRIHTP